MLQFAVVDRLLDEHGQARAQRARQSEDRHERVERAERQSWPVAFGRSPSSGLSVGRTPASSANVGFASCVFRCGIGRAGSCDADGSSDCASMAVRLLGRDGFRAMPNPRSPLRGGRHASAAVRRVDGTDGGECREMQICPCIQHWRMHGHTVQPKRLLWSENAGYPHSWRVAMVRKNPRPLMRAVSSEDHSAGTMETIFGALTMTLRGSLPPSRSATASSASSPAPSDRCPGRPRAWRAPCP